MAAFSTDAWVFFFHGKARLFPTNIRRRQPPTETTLGLVRSRLPISAHIKCCPNEPQQDRKPGMRSSAHLHLVLHLERRSVDQANPDQQQRGFYLNQLVLRAKSTPNNVSPEIQPPAFPASHHHPHPTREREREKKNIKNERKKIAPVRTRDQFGGCATMRGCG